jgi:hypothetical protein
MPVYPRCAIINERLFSDFMYYFMYYFCVCLNFFSHAVGKNPGCRGTSHFRSALLYGNARIAAIMEIPTGFPQLFGKLYEFPTILLKSKKQLFNIPTKPFIFLK